MLYEKIIKHYKEIKAIENTLALLNWDQSIFIPQKGVVSRSDTMATLAGMAHGKTLDDTYYENINNLMEGTQYEKLTDLQKKEMELIKTQVEKQRKVPAEFAEELTKTTSIGMSQWESAKNSGDDKEYLPVLQRIFKLKKEYAAYMGYKENPYDALLDDFDRGLTYNRIKPVFEKLEKSLVEILGKIKDSSAKVDDEFLYREFNKEEQVDFGLTILKDMGIDTEAFRQDYSEHPFTTTIGYNDVRITTHISERDFKNGFFSTVHEGGHALYELGSAKNLKESPAAHLESLSLHESQSRFYENIIGRSMGFWEKYFPYLQDKFPDPLKGISLEQFYKGINRVKKSPIRTEADEVHYNLHIILRTELENLLVNEKISTGDIEEAWNEKTKEIFGFYPENKSQGYLQDIHWSDGLFGYFPTYTLGNLISAQFTKTMEKDLGKFDLIDKELLGKIHHWLDEKIYAHGNTISSSELVKKLTGEELDSEYFIKYLEDKFYKVYDL